MFSIFPIETAGGSIAETIMRNISRPCDAGISHSFGAGVLAI
jgi:hypothetical protein